MLADREILINSCATSHDTHLSKLLTVEEGLRNRGNQTTMEMVRFFENDFCFFFLLLFFCCCLSLP